MTKRRSLLLRMAKAVGILLLVLLCLYGFHRAMTSLSRDHRSGPFPDYRCDGRRASPPRVLVAYDSKYGSTGGVAVAVGDGLCAEGLSAGVRLARDVKNLEGYGAVVVGTPLYNGRWLDGATEFLERFEDQLSGRKVAIFIAGNLMRPGKDTPDQRALARKWFIERVTGRFPKIKPLARYGMFAGKLDSGLLTRYERFIMWISREGDGDFRDYAKIRDWAREIAREIAPGR